MKTLPELRTELDLGIHLRGDMGNGRTDYVFRWEEAGFPHRDLVTVTYTHDKDEIYLQTGWYLTLEGEPGYGEPDDIENLSFWDMAILPIWETCIIPDNLMKRFLAEAAEKKRYWQADTSMVNTTFAMLQMERLINKLPDF